MLRREPGLIEAHNAQSELAHERAMERFSQHPQLNGNGKVRRQRQKEHEMAHNPEMSGGSAPRSMSRLVGHGKRKPRKAKKADSSSESDEEKHGGAMIQVYPQVMPGGRYPAVMPDRPAVMPGGRYSSEGMSDRMASPFHDERLSFSMGMPPGMGGGGHPAYHQGHMLAQFIRSKHGDEHARRMLHGMLHGGAWWDFLDPEKNGFNKAFDPARNGLNAWGAEAGRKIKNEFVNPDSDLNKWGREAGKKIENEFVNPDSVLRSQVLPIATQVGDVVLPFIPGGEGVALGLDALNFANDIATGIQKKGRGRRTPAGRIAEKQMRAEMGNVFHNPTMPGRGRPRKGCGQPNGVSEALGSPSNGSDPSGAVDVGRVANPSRMFARNTVGMGRTHPTSHPRHRVPASPAGVYFEGGGWGSMLGSIAKGVKTGVNVVKTGAEVAKAGRDIYDALAPAPVSGGYGGINHNNPTGTLNTGAGKKTRAKAGPSDARKKRGAEISRLMREKGMTLGQASKHIKEHGY